METKSLSFSAYDFLGYFFPGAMALMALDVSIAYHNLRVPFSYSALLERYSSKELGILLPFIILAYVLGHLLSYFSSVTVEKYAVWTHNHPSKYLMGFESRGYFETGGAHPRLSALLRGIVAVFMWPISILDFVFGHCFGLHKNYVHAVDPLIDAIVWGKMKALVGNELPVGADVVKLGQPKDHDYFQLALHFVIERAPQHLYTLRNYVVLYGFLRTVCFLGVLVTSIFAFHLWASSLTGMQKFVFTLFACLGCVGFYLAFLKFFRRYSEEVFFALVVSHSHFGKPPTVANSGAGPDTPTAPPSLTETRT